VASLSLRCGIMKVGDLVQVYRNPASNPIEVEIGPIMGILLDYNEEHSGWDILINDCIECYPDIWWSMKRINQ
jgi:hypothetical protein